MHCVPRTTIDVDSQVAETVETLIILGDVTMQHMFHMVEKTAQKVKLTKNGVDVAPCTCTNLCFIRLEHEGVMSATPASKAWHIFLMSSPPPASHKVSGLILFRLHFPFRAYRCPSCEVASSPNSLFSVISTESGVVSRQWPT
jgi:hypothetical protein